MKIALALALTALLAPLAAAGLHLHHHQRRATPAPFNLRVSATGPFGVAGELVRLSTDGRAIGIYTYEPPFQGYVDASGALVLAGDAAKRV